MTELEYNELHHFANHRCPRKWHFCDGWINLSAASGVDIGVCQYRDGKCMFLGHPKNRVGEKPGRKPKE